MAIEIKLPALGDNIDSGDVLEVKVREGDMILFERTFQDSTPARGFFARQKWNFDDVEYAYLHRAAVHQPGRFPDLLGADYPPKGEAFLLARSQAEEDNKKPRERPIARGQRTRRHGLFRSG